jgi:hypothetical protein
MTDLLEHLRNLPAVGSEDAAQQSKRTEPSQAEYEYVIGGFGGLTYDVGPREVQSEENPAARLVVLADLARQAEDASPYYPDPPEQAQEQAAVTAALYASQASAIAARDAQEQ